MFLILRNGMYWINKILHIFLIFLPPYLLPKRQKIENFQLLMLKFTISVSNLYMKPIWATFEFFTSDNHHMELSLPKFSDTYSICPHWFAGHQSWLIFSQNFKNGGFCIPTDFTDHIIVTPFSMFKDNSAQFFRKIRCELIKITYFLFLAP